MLSSCVDEILKLRTTRGPWALLAVGPLLVVAGVLGVVINDDLTTSKAEIGAVGHVGLVSMISLVFGTLAVAGEYRHRTVTDTYLATPRRGRVIAAKLATYTAVGLVYGLALAAVALATVLVAIPARGGSVHLSDAGLWRTLAGGVAWVTVFTAVGVALGALVRNLAVAVAGALAWIALVEGLVGQLVGGLRRWLPFSLGTALGNLPGTTVSQWVAALLLAGYAVAFAVAAVALSVRRDVT